MKYARWAPNSRTNIVSIARHLYSDCSLPKCMKMHHFKHLKIFSGGEPPSLPLSLHHTKHAAISVAPIGATMYG